MSFWKHLRGASQSAGQAVNTPPAVNASQPPPPPPRKDAQCRICFQGLGCDHPFSDTYCSRHRCVVLECPNARWSPTRLDNWTCAYHAGPEYTQSHPQTSASRPAYLSVDPKRPCGLCLDPDGTSPAIQGRRYAFLCKKHECITFGCKSPRCQHNEEIEPTHCQTHSKMHPFLVFEEATTLKLGPQPGSTAATTSTPRTSRRISGFKSWFGKKPLPDFSAPTPASSDPRLCEQGSFSGTITPELNSVEKTTTHMIKESSTTPPRTPKAQGVAPTDSGRQSIIPLTPRLTVQQPLDLGWHQCHAPGCQDKVLGDEIWVCQKHLDQGFWDSEDPPGFVDNPDR